MSNKKNILNIISWLFGTLFFAIGVVNTFRGNDPGLGIFILLISSVYFLPVNDTLKKQLPLNFRNMHNEKSYFYLITVSNQQEDDRLTIA